MDWLRLIFYGSKIISSNMPRSSSATDDEQMTKFATFVSHLEDFAIGILMLIMGAVVFLMFAVPTFWFFHNLVGLSNTKCSFIIGIPVALYIWYLKQWR